MKGKKFTALRNADRRKANPSRYLWENAKRRAADQGLPFEIEIADVIIPKRCPILGMKIKVYHKNRQKCATLDKIIPSLGYVKGNIAVISYRANRVKTNASFEELFAICEWLRRMI